MTWEAPEVRQLVEDRLRRARLELMEDSRLEQASHGQSGETPAFILQVVEEKLSAAARSGFEAAAASIRLEAAEWLHRQGQAVQDVRGFLRQTEEHCLKVPGRAAWQTLPRWIPAPVPVAAAVFAVLAVATLAAWWLLDLAPLAVVLLVALAGVPALVARAAAERVALSLKRHIAREYPARLCRQYLQAFDAGVAEYEKRVTDAAAEAA